MLNNDIVKNLSIADLERFTAYMKDLEQGLEIIRTFPQGVTIFGSARIDEANQYYEKARELGHLLANNGHAVITGGGPGIMEAANRGAFEYGGRSIGLNITLKHEQHPNPYLTDIVEFKYFFARKVMLAMASKAYVVFPGGFGTLDEFTDLLVLMEEGKMPKMPIFLFGKTFWRPLEKFFASRMVTGDYVTIRENKIYKITDNIKDIVTAANKIGHPKIKSNYYDGFDEA